MPPRFTGALPEMVSNNNNNTNRLNPSVYVENEISVNSGNNVVNGQQNPINKSLTTNPNKKVATNRSAIPGAQMQQNKVAFNLPNEKVLPLPEYNAQRNQQYPVLSKPVTKPLLNTQNAKIIAQNSPPKPVANYQSEIGAKISSINAKTEKLNILIGKLNAIMGSQAMRPYAIQLKQIQIGCKIAGQTSTANGLASVSSYENIANSMVSSLQSMLSSLQQSSSPENNAGIQQHSPNLAPNSDGFRSSLRNKALTTQKLPLSKKINGVIKNVMRAHTKLPFLTNNPPISPNQFLYYALLRSYHHNTPLSQFSGNDINDIALAFGSNISFNQIQLENISAFLGVIESSYNKEYNTSLLNDLSSKGAFQQLLAVLNPPKNISL